MQFEMELQRKSNRETPDHMCKTIHKRPSHSLFPIVALSPTNLEFVVRRKPGPHDSLGLA